MSQGHIRTGLNSSKGPELSGLRRPDLLPFYFFIFIFIFKYVIQKNGEPSRHYLSSIWEQWSGDIYISVKHKELRYALQVEEHTGPTGMSCDEDIILMDKIDQIKALGTDVI